MRLWQPFIACWPLWWCYYWSTAVVSSATSADAGASGRARYLLRNGNRIDLGSLPSNIVTDGIRLTTIDESKGLYYVCDFLTGQECEQVISFATPDRLARSPLTGGKATDGGFYHGTHRTSSTCPLLFASMYLPLIEQLRDKHPEYIPELELSWEITQRAAKLLQVEPSHLEPLQMIKYMPGEYYKKHHDHKGFYNPEDGYPDRSKTLLVFLNNVERGGHLRFDVLGLEFIPQRGDAVVWSNIHETTGKVDPDMIHQGLPPEPGSNPKYAMNVWIRDEPIELT